MRLAGSRVNPVLLGQRFWWHRERVRKERFGYGWQRVLLLAPLSLPAHAPILEESLVGQVVHLLFHLTRVWLRRRRRAGSFLALIIVGRVLKWSVVTMLLVVASVRE